MAFGQPYNPMGYSPYFAPGQAAPDQLSQLRAPYQPQPMAPQPQPNNGIVWVQGEAGAKSYLVGAGNSVLLMDSESQTFYLKTADPSGMPSMRVFDYTERTIAPKAASVAPAMQQVEYVTRQEFEALLARLEAPAQPKKKAKEVLPDGEPVV